MKYIYQVIREWSQDNGTQYNVLGVYTDLSGAEDAAGEAAKYGGSDEDRRGQTCGKPFRVKHEVTSLGHGVRLFIVMGPHAGPCGPARLRCQFALWLTRRLFTTRS